MKPVIGISARLDEESRSAALSRYYIEALIRAGGAPVLLPPAEGIDTISLLSRMDGLLLSGGEDAEPELYGESILPACGKICPERDDFDLALLASAETLSLPVLGICRGIQMMNIYYGGTLYQDLESQCGIPRQRHSPGHHELWHDVTIAPGSRLADILGEGPCRVNSSHHQAVKSTKLTSAARDDYGLIEAIEKPGERFVVGVQWHPERLADDRLMRAFVRECGR